MQQSGVETALDRVRPAPAATLQLDNVAPDDRPNSAGLVLDATPDVCLDCLVPDEMLVQIIETAIADQDSSLDCVVLTNSGFEAVADR